MAWSVFSIGFQQPLHLSSTLCQNGPESTTGSVFVCKTVPKALYFNALLHCC